MVGIMDTQTNIAYLTETYLTETPEVFDRFAAKHGSHCVIFDDGQRQSICLRGERGHRRLLNYSRRGLVGVFFESADDCAEAILQDSAPIF
jgi:hypothetical protein